MTRNRHYPHKKGTTMIPTIADLRTALDVLESLREEYIESELLDPVTDRVQAVLFATCPHERLATGPQCMDCGQYL